MANDIIEVEGLSKMYRLGEINTGSLSHDLTRWWSRMQGKEDPYQLIAETNFRQVKGNSGYVWSLKDINFSVREGEVFGIIGKNGAGKSTLLKLLSKITKPTKGCIRIDGRIASLLEVGTGFHPDLSGRENIFLNGAILGMKKQEIRNRFDEIVDFSGIERYIDTPVKRYSSGMFVRLAFAVAAHLEPDILIIDEVLAVGDAEFQQKCMGKMQDVSKKQGRTIIFVSHNIVAIKQLCTRALLLENGQAKITGSLEKVLEIYQFSETDTQKGKRRKLPETGSGFFLDWRLEGQRAADAHSCFTGEYIQLVFRFQSLVEMSGCQFHLLIRSTDGFIVLHADSLGFSGKNFFLVPGIHELSFQVSLPIKKGNYELEAGLVAGGKLIDSWATSTRLRVLDHFEGQQDDSYAGMLNIKTSFSVITASALKKQME
ncbi:ABC transporter ATP-binding protein [Flavitalea flava]